MRHHRFTVISAPYASVSRGAPRRLRLQCRSSNRHTRHTYFALFTVLLNAPRALSFDRVPICDVMSFEFILHEGTNMNLFRADDGGGGGGTWAALGGIAVGIW